MGKTLCFFFLSIAEKEQQHRPHICSISTTKQETKLISSILSCAAPERRPPPARPSTGFLKPSSDDEDSGPRNTSIPAWKKSSNPARESDGLEKPQQEKERGPGKIVTAPQDGLCVDKAAVTTSRF